MKRKAQETSENRCGGCGNHNALYECTGCHEASFCSQDCQRKTWSSHRFDCLPCSICGERIPGTQVRRDCSCKKGGYSHITCLVEAAVEDSGGKEWSFSSTQFEKCKCCEDPYTGDTKEVLDGERKARIEKAKARLHHLLITCQELDDNKDEIDCTSFVQLARDTIVLFHGVYGEDDWTSNDNVFWAFYFLGRALLHSDCLHEAAETLELYRAKIHEHKPDQWKQHVRKAETNLATAYYRLNDYSRALPVFEALYDKHYHTFTKEIQCWVKTCLVHCYYCTGALKEVHRMIEPTLRQSEEVNGRNHQNTLDLKGLHDKISKGSYNVAETCGVEDIPDGTSVEIAHYLNGSFRVAVETSDEDYEFFTVSPEQVIMIPDSDVVLHSLKGAKHLNGKLGIIETFNHELGRYVVIVRGTSKSVNVKPTNLLPAYMGCEKEKMMELAIELSKEDEYVMN